MSTEDHKQALPGGFHLSSYRVVRVLGAGGFGVTYLCEHAGLGVQVAVKEYLPNEIAVRDGTAVHPKSAGDREGFEWGLSRFLDEARTLARFEHPNVVRVRDCFEANSTAYIVMDYEDGEPLDRLLQRLGTLTEAQLKRVVLPVADGLRHVHAAGFLHRDVKPSNIFVRRSDESPVLLDFGSARQALGRKSRSVTAIASAGYSPPEQYEKDGAHGAWTDIYALSALCYRAITGNTPMEAPRRQGQLLRTQTDPLPRLAESAAPGYSPAFLEAVNLGLRVIETERPQDVDDWLARMQAATSAKTLRSLTAASRGLASHAASSPRSAGLGQTTGQSGESKLAEQQHGSRRRGGSGLDDTAEQGDADAERRHVSNTATARRTGAVGRLVGRIGLAKTFWLFGLLGSAVINTAGIMADRKPAGGPAASSRGGLETHATSATRGSVTPATSLASSREKSELEKGHRGGPSGQGIPLETPTRADRWAADMYSSADRIEAWRDSIPLAPKETGAMGFMQDVAGGTGYLLGAAFLPPLAAGHLGGGTLLAAMLYWLAVLVGIWRAAGMYGGWRGWAVLARTHVVVQALLLPTFLVLPLALSS